MPSVADCLKVSAELQGVSESPRLDVELLLAHVLQKDRSWLYTWPEQLVSPDKHYEFLQLVSRRSMGEPVAYLVGRKGFWSLELEVNPSTLVPRPETELLVELALQKLGDDRASVLDLGTGTGAIALAIAKEKPQAHVLGVDSVAEAVQLAKRNAEINSISNVEFIQSTWFAGIPKQYFNLIVSNPPYIDAQDPHLTQGDVRFEPKTALVAENHGYADIEHIIVCAKNFLIHGAFLMIEHGYQQGEKVRALFETNHYVEITTHRDLAQQERVTFGRLAQ